MILLDPVLRPRCEREGLHYDKVTALVLLRLFWHALRAEGHYQAPLPRARQPIRLLAQPRRGNQFPPHPFRAYSAAEDVCGS